MRKAANGPHENSGGRDVPSTEEKALSEALMSDYKAIASASKVKRAKDPKAAHRRLVRQGLTEPRGRAASKSFGPDGGIRPGHWRL